MKSLAWLPGQTEIPYHIGYDCAETVARQLAALEPDVLFVLADSRVRDLHGKRYEEAFSNHVPTRVAAWTGSESTKSLQSVEKIITEALGSGISRRSILVGMGGGVVGNMAGLAASLLFRGIRFVHLPTTLLAMHDSVTSLKQGVNCAGLKNIIGTFYRPTAIFVDLSFLESLPASCVRAGLVELVKNALVLDNGYLEAILARLPCVQPSSGWQELIEIGVAMKNQVMQEDALEKNLALVFEYGHTVGHALELTCHGSLNHGDSVAWGMRCAAWIARELGYMTEEVHRQHDALLDRLAPFPVPSSSVTIEEIELRLKMDNKRGYLADRDNGAVAMVLLREPGAVVFGPSGQPLVPVPGPVVHRSLEQLRRLWEN